MRHNPSPLARAIRGTRLALLAGIGLGAPLFGLPGTVYAEQQAAQNFSIPPGRLDQALSQFGRQAGIPLSVDSALLAGKSSPGLQGHYGINEGFVRLLAGTGFEALRQADGSYLLMERTSSALALDATSVTAMGNESVTEGSGSYAARTATIGKTAQTLREIPQSVSVVTRKLMDDKNLVSLDQVMAQAPGITRANRGYGNHHFSSRGFDLTDESYMVDGVVGQAYAYTGWMAPDMAMFDRVEILRGAAGLLVGAGGPGGAVNLARKRPGSDPKFSTTLRAGSWDNYRLDLDASGKLNAEGTLRGRMVASYEDRGYFIDVTESKRPLLYGIVEADLGAGTTVAAGLRRQTSRTDGYSVLGLPSNPDGSNPHLKRSTFLGQDWATLQSRTDEVFADLSHRFNDDWNAKMALSHSESSYNRNAIEWGARDTLAYGSPTGPVITGTSFHKFDATSNAVDAHLDGNFELFGLTHQVTLGANWSRRKMNDKDTTARLSTPIPLNVYSPNHSLLAKPARPDWEAADDTIDTRYGTYLNARLHMTEDLSLVLGTRLSWYKTQAWDGPRVNTNEQKHELTPFVGAIYDLDENWSLYASYADIFMPQANYRSVGGSMLDPAIGSNYETGIKGELFDRRLNVSMAVFYIKQQDVAARDYANDGKCPQDVASRCYVNSKGTNRSKGFETEVSGEILPGLQVAAGYTFNTTRSQNGGPISAQTPKHLLRATTHYTLPGDWSHFSIGGGVSAQSSYEDAYNETGNSGRAVFDARAAYAVDQNWTLGVDIANLLDRKYFDSVGYWTRGTTYGTPRSYMLTLRGDF